MVSSVSSRVAVEIVDGLESVEIDVQKGERVSVPLQIVEARLDAGPEVAPVG
jgi:L-alanine-DL-glutamate epimerase-like enolase superfamily enzyme